MSDWHGWAWLKAHISEAFGWSRDTEFKVGEGVIAGLGFVGPILLAASLGNVAPGLAAAAGSLPIGRVGIGRSLADQTRSLVLSVAPTMCAAAFAEPLVAAGSTGKVLTVALAALAGTAGGYDRIAAVVTTRFTLFLIIAQSLAAATPHHGMLLLLSSAGALWTAILWLFFGAIVRATNPKRLAMAEPIRAAAPGFQKLTRWRISLMRPAGWHFTIKLVLCLAAAEAFDWAFPNHHLHWIALTVVILAQRRGDPIPVKITQRALGAVVGVVAAGLCLALRPAVWLLIASIGVIAGMRPLLKARHYLGYTALMTTLIVFMMDFAQPPDRSVLTDRVLATFIGAGLVVAANLAGSRLRAHTSTGPK